MFPIFIFTGMGSEPQNAFLPPGGCFRRKQKQQMPCAAAALPVKKRIPENPQIFRNCVPAFARYAETFWQSLAHLPIDSAPRQGIR